MKKRESTYIQTYLVSGEEDGQDYNQTSAGTFNRFTQTLHVWYPFLVESLRWNIATAQTYSLQIVSSTAASPTIYTTLFSGSLVSGMNTITLPFPFLLLPGNRYISMHCSTAVVWRRNSADQPTIFTAMAFGPTGYDGASPAAGGIPCYLTGSYYQYLGDT